MEIFMSYNHSSVLHDAFFEEHLMKAISKLKFGLNKQIEKREALINSLHEIQKIKNYQYSLSDRTKMWKVNAIIDKCSRAKIYQTGNVFADCINQMSEEEIDQTYRRLEMLMKY